MPVEGAPVLDAEVREPDLERGHDDAVESVVVARLPHEVLILPDLREETERKRVSREVKQVPSFPTCSAQCHKGQERDRKGGPAGLKGVFTLSDAWSFFRLTSKISPLGSMLDFDADVNVKTA